MYEPVLTDEKSDLYNVYEVHENYRILAMAVNVPLQVAEEICHILNEFEIKSLQPCPYMWSIGSFICGNCKPNEKYSFARPSEFMPKNKCRWVRMEE